jgi:penicillin amidase
MIGLSIRTIQRVLQLIVLLSVGVGTTLASAAPAESADTLVLNSPYGRVGITRDNAGIPHIRSRGENAAQFGLGYVHAQDRLWQMDFNRRLANGRTAEFLGADGLRFDRLFRTLGLRRVAEAAWAKLSPRERQPFEAYSDGINLYLSSLPSQHLPPEYGVLNVQPEPWTPIDILAFGKLFTWSNGSNFDKELLRGQLAALLGPERAAQLTPTYTKDGPVTVGAAQPSALRSQSFVRSDDYSVCHQHTICADLLALHRDIALQTGIGADGRGSNAWVLSGSRTTTGKPILANDPHLTAQAPALWYLAKLSYQGRTVIGATAAGGLGVQSGHNGLISWGVTTINVDSQDLYIEQVNERNEALFQGVWEPMQIVTETIKVKGQSDVVLNVRISRHGPLLSDAISPTGPALAIKWTGFDPVDPAGLFTLALNRARTFTEFTEAFRDNRSTDQNYLYADNNGNIGYIAGGTIPLRARGNGSVPVPGWTGEYEWQGYLPWEQLPRSYNPPEGYIANSNNRVTNDALADVIGNSYAAPYRIARVFDMIAAKDKHSPQDVAAMQADVLSPHARKLMPLLLRTRPVDARGQQALDLLRTWDMRATGDSAATAVFEAWYIRIAQHLFADELGGSESVLWGDYGRTLNFVGMATETALLENQVWCDDVRTPAVEHCAELLATALSDGLNDMAQAQGSEEIANWRWDRVHRVQFLHQPLGNSPQAGPIFNRSIANGGDKFTVNVASSFRKWEDFDQFHAPQYRQIIDHSYLWQNSRWMIGPGQSGVPSSPHYDDLIERWQRVEYLPMR